MRAAFADDPTPVTTIQYTHTAKIVQKFEASDHAQAKSDWCEFAKSLTAIQGSSPRVPPGSFDDTVVVRIASQKGLGIAYSIDGRDPECPMMGATPNSISKADILLEKTAQLKVKSCTRQGAESGVVSASYTIN